MNATELRGKTAAERNEMLQDLYREHFNLRMQNAIGRLPKPTELRRVRREIARILTVTAESKDKS